MTSKYPIVVSSCDLYKDAWEPFFRLLQINWNNCPKKVYLITETQTYVDPYFDISILHCDSPIWSDRMISAIKQIDSDYFWFFLEDFFLQSSVNHEIICAAIKCIEQNADIGVIKFIPHITSNWYDNSTLVSNYFSPIPPNYKSRSNLMLSLYNKRYFQKILRKKESPWDFEKFGTYRSRLYKDKILVQNNIYPLALPYEYQIKYGYGISAKKWLKNNKLLFDQFNITVNFDKLGWYNQENKVKIIGLKRSKKEKILMPIKQPKLFIKIISVIMKEKLYCLTHLRHYF